MSRLTMRKSVMFACLAVALSSVVCVLALVALDLSLHKKYERVAGLNVRGYRGPVLGRKRAGEQRVVMLGGSTVFGYGVGAHETISAYLEQALNEPTLNHDGRITVVNLGYNNEGAYSFLFTLRDYAYLKYDLAVLYQGYNDLGDVQNTAVYRHSSPVFRLTGYLPILPLVLREKWMAIRYGGNLEAAYHAQKTAFTARAADPTSAESARRRIAIAQSLKRQLGQGPATHAASEPSQPLGCETPWGSFCDSISAAVDDALAHNVPTLIVTPPYISESHRHQQQALLTMLQARYANEPRVRHVVLGEGVVDVDDPAICFDGVHLSAAGNARVAQRLVEPVMEMLRTTRRVAQRPGNR